jgi:hypothetical protein
MDDRQVATASPPLRWQAAVKTDDSNFHLEDHTMNESVVTLADVEDDILNYEVADEAEPVAS